MRHIYKALFAAIIAFTIATPAFAAPFAVPVGGTGSSTLSGIIKGNGTSPVQTAVPGTDYLTPTGSGAGLSGIVTSVFGRSGAVIAQTGDYTTAQITEVTNLFFTNARAIGATLTGFVSGAGTVSSSDTILSAIDKLDGNIAAKLSNITGLITAGTNVTITGSGTSGSPYVINSSGGGGGGGSGTVSTSSSEVANEFPFWTTTSGTPALLSGTSNLFSNGSNIGIGSSSPAFSLGVVGNAYVGQNGVAPTSMGTVLTTNTADLNSNVIINSFQAAGAVNASGNVQALQFNVSDTGANSVSTLTGVNGLASKSGSGTVTTLIGVQASTRLAGTAVATTMTGFNSQPRVGTGTSAGTLVNFNVAAATITGTGSVTSAYGVKVAAQKVTGVTTGYGFASDGASDLNYFVGNTGVGTTSPYAQLSVGGNAVIGASTAGGTNGTLTVAGIATGLVKSTNGLFGSAAAGTDYQAPITLTTTGTSGAATFISNTLNIPQYAGTTYTATWPITLTGSAFGFNGLSTSTAAVIGNVPYFSGVNTFANVATSTPTVNAPITYSGTLGSFVGGTGGAFDCTTATGSVKGCISAADWTTFNGKQAAGSYITGLTGDGTASGPGSVALTLATVNANTGSWGSSTAIPVFTVNGKGLITAASTAVVIAPAGTLSGTTLNSTVVNSSLTSVGTLTALTVSGNTSLANATSTNFFSGRLTTNTFAAGGTASTTIDTTGLITTPNVIDSGLTASALVYSNASKQLSSVTLGTGLSLVSGTLTNTGATSLTTTGSGAATLVSGVLNIPTPSASTNFFSNSGIFTSLSTGTNLGLGTTSPYSTLAILDSYATTTVPFSIWGAASSTAQTNVQTFNSSGTWTNPGGSISSIKVQSVGSGGGGGSPNSGSSGGSGGSSSNFAAAVPCIATGGGGGGGSSATVAQGGDGSGGATTGAGTDGTHSSGGGSGALETCTYTSASAGTTVTVTVATGGHGSTGSGSFAGQGSGFFTGNDSSNNGVGGAGGGSTGTPTGASSGGVTTNGNPGVLSTGTAAGGAAVLSTFGKGGNTTSAGNNGVVIVTTTYSVPTPFPDLVLQPVTDALNQIQTGLALGTTTPNALFTIQTYTTSDFLDFWGTVSGKIINFFSIDGNGHLIHSEDAQPTVSSCGTGSPAMIAPSNDTNGSIQIGAGTVNNCTITLAHPPAAGVNIYVSAFIVNGTTNAAFQQTSSPSTNTSFTIHSTTNFASVQVGYIVSYGK